MVERLIGRPHPRTGGVPEMRAQPGYARPMLRRQAPQRPGWLVAPGFVLVALAGAWLTHTLEYLRVWGTAGLTARLTAPLHLWMLPLGGGLLALAALGSVRWALLYRGLGTALDAAGLRLERRWRNLPTGDGPGRGRRRAPLPPPPRASFGARLAATSVLLGACISALYLVQENIEAAAAGMPAPGLGPMTGLHWAAPIIVAAVAFTLSAVVVECRRRATAAAGRVDRVERLVAALLRRAGLHAGRRPHPAFTGPSSPLERLGAQLWRRPPPVGLTAR